MQKKDLLRLIRSGLRHIYRAWLSFGSNVATWLKIAQIYLGAGRRFLAWRARLWLRNYRIMESTQTSMKKQTLLFIRHGQTTWNIEQRLPGQLPGIGLTDAGRQQAARLADALSVLPISAIISSPLERARDTAEILAQTRHLEVQFEPDLMDTDVGHWAGEKISELSKKDPAWGAYVRDPSVAPSEDIETFPEVQRRVVAAVERWCDREESGANPAFVAHADVVKLLLAHYTGLEAARAGTLFIDNASVSIVELEPEHKPRVIAIGWSPRPGWLRPPTAAAPEQAENGEQLKGNVQ